MVGVLGLNHKTADSDIRNKFSITSSRIINISEQIMQQCSLNGIVVLSTCMRTEFYFSSSCQCSGTISSSMLKSIQHTLNLSNDYSAHFYSHYNSKAVKHLFEVISGVDSMVLGENQIVNQIKKAYINSTEANLTDAILMRTFQKAFECSKKVRTQTDIQKGATSVGYVAIDMCEKECPDFTNKTALVIGAGETGKLSMQNILNRGLKSVNITNRTDSKAISLANKYNVNPILFSNYKDHLHLVDIVITATDAGLTLISKTDVENAQNLSSRKQWYIDLSMPRNIDTEISKLNNISLRSVDDIKEIVDENNKKRVESVDNANVLIDTAVDETIKWIESRNLKPVINTITKNIREFNSNAVEEYSQNFNSESIADIEKYSELLTQKYIRRFIKNLNEKYKGESNEKQMALIKELFELN